MSERIAICIASFRRPNGLAALLASLHAQALDSDVFLPVDVIVVDNDSAGSARAALERTSAPPAFRTEYLIEPARGIAAARNSGVRRALVLGAAWLVFVDDDELVPSDWLAELVSCAKLHSAAIVSGPIMAAFASAPPRWITDGKFFERSLSRSTGERLEPNESGCGNLLVARAVFERVGDFSAELGLRGGEDVEFLKRARQAGFPIIACREAAVRHVIDPRRVSARWLLQRSFRWGNHLAAMELRADGGAKSKWAVFRLGASSLKAELKTIIRFALKRRAFADIFLQLRSAAKAFGVMAGALGVRYEEYRYFSVVE